MQEVCEQLAVTAKAPSAPRCMCQTSAAGLVGGCHPLKAVTEEQFMPGSLQVLSGLTGVSARQQACLTSAGPHVESTGTAHAGTVFLVCRG